MTRLTGTAARRLAIINGQTFSKGDVTTVKVTGKTVQVRCAEVREASVLVSIAGLEGQRELRLTRS